MFSIARWCSIKGDGFCDTPADPSPILLPTATDNFGQTFVPEKKNYMGYYITRSLFSQSQRGVILFNLKTMLVFGDIDPNMFAVQIADIKDKYEKDDSWTLSKEIKLEEIQERQLFEGGSCTIDPIDVINFSLNGRIVGNYIFEVTPTTGNDFIESVNVFSASNLNSNKPAGQLPLQGVVFSNDRLTATIPCDRIPSDAAYLIFEVKKVPGLSGHYKAKITRDINLKIIPEGPTFCVGGTPFDLDGKLPNMSYTWAGQGLILSNNVNSAPTTVLATSGNGKMILNAIVDYQGCRETISKDLTGKIANSQPPAQVLSPQILITSSDCYNYKGKLTVDVTGAVSVVVNVSMQGQPTATISKSPFGDWYDISGSFIPLQSFPNVIISGEIVATNACGDVTTVPFTRTISKTANCRSGRDVVQISPNPADDHIFISITPKEEVANANNLQRRIVIMSLEGEIKYDHMSDESNMEIPLNEFQDGFYIIQVFRENDDDFSVENFIIARGG